MILESKRQKKKCFTKKIAKDRTHKPEKLTQKKSYRITFYCKIK